MRWALVRYVAMVVLVSMEASAQHAVHDRVEGLLQRGRPYPAIKRCDAHLRKNAPDARLLALRAQGRNAIAEYSGAWDDAQRALELAPADPLALVQGGVAALALGRVDAAVALLERAPAGSERDLRLAMALGLQGRCADAMPLFDRAVAAGDAKALRERGACHAAVGDTTRARADMDLAVEMSPRDPAAWNSRGLMVWAARGEHVKAVADYDQAIKLDPNFSFAFNNRGASRLQLGQLDKAERDLRLASRKNPRNAYVDHNLALLALARNDVGKACAHLHDALAKGGTPQRGGELQELIARHCPAMEVPKPSEEQAPTPPAPRHNAPGPGNAP